MRHLYTLKLLIVAGVLGCIANSLADDYDPSWTRSQAASYAYHGLHERYVYAGSMGFIDNNKWDSPSIEGLDCSSYVSRCLALPEYIAESEKRYTYPYNTYELFFGEADHLVRINSVYDLQPYDVWVWRSSHGGPSTGHTGLFVQYSGSYFISREALNAENGIVERKWRMQDMVDWGARYYRRENWASSTQIPTVETEAASNIDESSATLNAAIIDTGGRTVDQQGFVWGRTSACDDGWLDGVETSYNEFNASLNGLTPDTLYYFQAMAHNSNGWATGDVRSFRTDVIPTGSQVIIDNSQSGTSSTGTWDLSGGSDPYGANSLWANEGATYTWKFIPLPAGTYQVSMWWTEYSSRGTNVPVSISHANGTTQTTVNQQTNGGQWNSLGQYYFDGDGGQVRLTAQSGTSISSCADAVRFSYIQNNQQPLAVIDSISPASSIVGQQVTMIGHGSDDGTITAYQWISNLDGLLGTSATVTTSSLREGTHIISFRVQDNLNVWSDMVEEMITVTEEPSSGTEVVIDNGDAQTSSTGTWKVSGGENPWQENSLWGRDGATYTWQPDTLTPGTYEVYMWWTEFSSRGDNIQVRVNHADGYTDQYVNQQNDGGQWNSLGLYNFDGSGAVTLFAPSAYPTSYCADAVKFVRLAEEEIIIDNGNSGTTSSGTWGVSGGADPYGVNSLWARETATYRWSFTPQQGGMYAVYLWWTEYSSRGSAIPVMVAHRYGTANLTVDQQNNGGQWNPAGTYSMQAGQPYYIQISTAGDGSTASADAVRILRIAD